MKKYIETMQNNPLFRGLEKNDITAVLRVAGARILVKKTDEYILWAGDTTAEMGFVISGSVIVVQEDLWGRRNIMSRVSAGDIFAETFAAAGATLNVSVIANEDCKIMFLNVKRLLSIMHKNTPYGNTVICNFISLLAQKTLAFNDKVTHISKKNTKEKLLSFLSAQALRQGALSFSIAFNRQQLADYLCVERAAMSVELSKLQKEGILSYNRNHFELREIMQV